VVHQEIVALFKADHDERKQLPPFGSIAYYAVRLRDTNRRRRVRQIINSVLTISSEDRYYAALVLHHGGDVNDVWLAHTLASMAVAQDFRPARWLTAATLDRWLMLNGQHQKYGTQIVPDGTAYRVWPVDPATTDADRRRWDVRPFAAQLARADAFSQTEPQPSMDRAPEWLKVAIKEWQTGL
jgi:hypothetical protein